MNLQTDFRQLIFFVHRLFDMRTLIIIIYRMFDFFQLKNIQLYFTILLESYCIVGIIVAEEISVASPARHN